MGKYSKKVVAELIKQEIHDATVFGKIKEAFPEYEISYPNIIGKNKKYIKFILLSKPRSGSTLVVSSLNSHPNIVCYGETFLENECHFDYFPFFPANNDQSILYLRDKNPIKFLKAFIYRKYLPNFTSVGFKLFYFQNFTEIYPSLGKFILKNKDIHIIHLIRRNSLKCLISHKIAELTNQWQKIDPLLIDIIIKNELCELFPYAKLPIQEENESFSLELNFEETRDYFIESDRMHEDYKKKFQNHPYLEIFYEDIETAPNKHMEIITKFLGAQNR